VLQGCFRNSYQGHCIIINRGYGREKYKFKYAYIDLEVPYYIESHLLIIYCSSKEKMVGLLQKFKGTFFLEFMNLYFSNQSLSVKELSLLPIF